MDCAICLNHIDRQNEAYLYPCFHFFCFTCVESWTDRQRQHEAGAPCPGGQRCSFTCPLCKQPYTAVVYDCIGTSYRLLPTCGQPKTMSAMPLTADQSRRRALYVTPHQPHAVGPQEGRAARPRAPTDKQTTEWLQRELKAVLLAEDVDVIVQHVAGVLRSRASAKQQPARRAGASAAGDSALYGSRQDFQDRMAAAMAGFLNEHSARFAEELWAFLHSGLSIAAYDQLMFGPCPQPPPRPPADTGMEPHRNAAQQQLPDAQEGDNDGLDGRADW